MQNRSPSTNQFSANPFSSDPFSGIITALITPLIDDKIDEPTLRALINRQIAAGIKAVVIAGSTGEGNCLTIDEISKACEVAADAAAGRLAIIASISAASTNQAQDAIRRLEQPDKSTGAVSAYMCTMPHYVRPSAEGAAAHFKALSMATQLPVMLYSNAARTGKEFSQQIIAELIKLPNICAYKDAEGNTAMAQELSTNAPEFKLLAGDDQNIIPYSAAGGSGCVSVIANLLPKEMLQIQQHISANNYQAARALVSKIWPLMEAINAAGNPAGIKYAMHLSGLCALEYRLPLLPPRAELAANIQKEMAHFSILSA